MAPNEEASRYAGALGNALCWWLHDFFMHPLTGTIGLVGRLCGSLRLLSVSHHLHNATAPSNDVLADYAEAAYRAGCNETRGNPMGSMTPDELDHAYEQAKRIKPDVRYGEEAQVLEDAGLRPGFNQAAGGKAPPLLSKEEIAALQDSLPAARYYAALEQLAVELTESLGEYELRRQGFKEKIERLRSLRALAIKKKGGG